MSNRNPAKDRVAIAAASTTGFWSKNTPRSAGSYVLEACVDALNECGLSADDIDGIVGTNTVDPRYVQSGLGIPEVTYFANPVMPIGNSFCAAVAAVHSGLCTTALLYHGAYRLPWNTGSAIKDPFRRGTGATSAHAPRPEHVAGSLGYTAWASRYMHEYGIVREDFGRFAINERTNAARNPAAAMTDPLTMDDYLSARMIRWPLGLYDMDIAVDGADAFVITTAERARDLPHRPVLVHSAVLGMIDRNSEEQSPSLRRHGQQVVVDALRTRSDFWIDDIDVYFPYDGFTPIALNWFENVGWCGPGEAGAFIRQHWDEEAQRIMINGRVPVNPHGGSLSEGATQGSGHLREAVHQLQGNAGDRQVEGAQRALLTPGGFFFNAQGITLRTN